MKKTVLDDEVKFKRRELTEILFRVLGAALLLGGSIAFPNLPIALGVIVKAVRAFKSKPFDDRKVMRSLKLMKKNNVIDIITKEDNVYVVIESKGKEKILKYSIKALLDFKRKSHMWTGRWYMVFFDVPEIERIKRDRLRQLLKEVGFYPYQKSVYTFPFECKKEVELIKQIVDGTDYLKYLVAVEIEDEKKLISYFGL